VPFYARAESDDEKSLFLDAVCCRLEPAIYPPGETVYDCNDRANCMFIVTKVLNCNAMTRATPARNCNALPWY
jgi:hypothetical protein